MMFEINIITINIEKYCKNLGFISVCYSVCYDCDLLKRLSSKLDNANILEKLDKQIFYENVLNYFMNLEDFFLPLFGVLA